MRDRNARRKEIVDVLDLNISGELRIMFECGSSVVFSHSLSST